MITKIKRLLKKKESPEWELSKENKEAIDDRIADFILCQAENALTYSLEVADKTTNRAYAVIILIVPLTSTAINLLITEITRDKKTLNGGKIEFFEFITVLCVAVLILLLTIILPRLTMGRGRMPRDMAHDNMLQNENTHERKLLLFKLNEIKNLQYKIDYNTGLNRKRILRFKVALLIICAGFIGGAMIYAMIE